MGLRAELCRDIELAEPIIDQSERRVLRAEAVPGGEKLVSIVEDHTDVIVKDRH